jgi:hypothetical protein
MLVINWFFLDIGNAAQHTTTEKTSFFQVGARLNIERFTERAAGHRKKVTPWEPSVWPH